jgi:hypothetical protein
MVNKYFIKLSALQVILCFCILSFLGCATYKDQKQLDTFEKTTDSYELAIRWGYYEMAYKFIRIKDNEKHAPAFDRFEDIKVTSYEIQRINVSENKQSAMQTVEIQYYKINQMIQKTLIDRQSWEYDVTEQKWYLHSGLPDFR